MDSVLIERNPAQDKGLRPGALGLASSVVIAVSSTAPAYSMAATLGLVVAIVGVHGRMHPRYLTPTAATVAMGAVSAVLFVVLTVVSRNVLADSAASVGLLIAFCYGLTGFASVWFFRRDLLVSVRALALKGILPGLGGLALLAAFIGSIVSYWPAASSYSSFDGVGGIFLIGAGSLLAGVVAMLAARRWLPAFFTAGTLPPLAPASPPATAVAEVATVAAVATTRPAQVLDPA